MQPIKRLNRILADLADPEHYLFTLSDLRAALPDLSSTAFRVLLSRAGRSGLLRRVCRGVYLRSEEHTSELQSQSLISYAVFCLKKKKHDVFSSIHNQNPISYTLN